MRVLLATVSRVMIASLALLAATCIPAMGQDGHRHPPQDVEAHKSFYWYLTRPDIENAQRGSCCGDGDCYPTPARFVNGQWQALRREDQQWIAIPESRVVTREDELARRPDQQATLCATVSTLYCFVPPQAGI